jgi:hypothetical protein
MSYYKNATVKLYAATADLLASPAPIPIKTISNSVNQYPMDGLDPGDYFYTIEGSGKGTILDFIKIPDDYATDIMEKTLNPIIYPAAALQRITVIDEENHPINEELTIKVDNYPYKPTEENSFELSNVSRNPAGIIVEFICAEKEPLKIRRGFPLVGNAEEIHLNKEFGCTVNFVDARGLNVNSSISSATVNSIDQTDFSGIEGRTSSNTPLNQGSGKFLLPASLCYKGHIYLQAIGSDKYKISPANRIVPLQSTDGVYQTLTFKVEPKEGSERPPEIIDIIK